MVTSVMAMNLSYGIVRPPWSSRHSTALGWYRSLLALLKIVATSMLGSTAMWNIRR